MQMTPEQMARARKRLGLSLEQLASMLGYQGVQRRQMQYDLETGRREIREPQRRLMDAYLSGYRPADWPQQKDSE
jgi:transcriptional regulator with XRE-family HTH domain